MRLVGVHEHGRAALGQVGDRLALLASCTADDDEARIAGGVLRRRLLVEGRAHRPQLVLVTGGVQAADEVAEAAARDVEVEEARGAVAGHRERVHDLGRDEHPRLGSHAVLAVLEPERELALEDEERLRVALVDVQRRHPARLRADLGDADLVEVGEERDAEPALAGDALSLAYLDHVPAA